LAQLLPDHRRLPLNQLLCGQLDQVAQHTAQSDLTDSGQMVVHERSGEWLAALGLPFLFRGLAPFPSRYRYTLLIDI
jgi:hypothetical protein